MAKVRESNIELLRNISMFMILVIHANFVALPRIEYNELASNTVPSVSRFFIESMGIVAVNVFVFISGWFGINVTKKRVFSFVYLILFIYFGGGILFMLLGKASFNFRWLLDVFQLSGKDWFIKSYLVLMILAPILNNYCKTAEEKTQRNVMIAFFLFEAIFGWVAGGSRFFKSGYGPLHFIGLYIAAQYIHYQINKDTVPVLFRRLFRMPKWADIVTFLITVIMNTMLVMEGSKLFGNVSGVFDAVYAYSNPLVIIGAIYLLLFFKKIEMPYIRIVNWMGASSFAVYLFHSEGTIRNQFFSPQIQYVFNNYSGVKCIAIIAVFLCFIYLVSVIVDQLRILTWNKIWPLIGS